MTWVLDRYYYIVNFKYFTRPRVYPIYFTNRNAAKRALTLVVQDKREKVYYEILKGKKLKEFKLKYVLCLGTMPQFTKYAYPEDRNTIQKRKSFRTLLRRRLRRMGMLTLVRNKYPVGEEKIIKPIKNTQVVANNKASEAIVFRIERRNPNHYYLTIKKKLAKKKGILWIVKALKVDIKEKTIIKVRIPIRRKDLLVPCLFKELIHFYGEGEYIMDRCRKAGIKTDFRKFETIPKILRN